MRRDLTHSIGFYSPHRRLTHELHAAKDKTKHTQQTKKCHPFFISHTYGIWKNSQRQPRNDDKIEKKKRNIKMDMQFFVWFDLQWSAAAQSMEYVLLDAIMKDHYTEINMQ